MSLKEGDQITVTYSPKIGMPSYSSINPTVSVTRTLGVDPVTELQTLRASLYKQLVVSIATEINVLDNLATVGETADSFDEIKEALYACYQEDDTTSPAQEAREKSNKKGKKKLVRRSQ